MISLKFQSRPAVNAFTGLLEVPLPHCGPALPRGEVLLKSLFGRNRCPDLRRIYVAQCQSRDLFVGEHACLDEPIDERFPVERAPSTVLCRCFPKKVRARSAWFDSGLPLCDDVGKRHAKGAAEAAQLFEIKAPFASFDFADERLIFAQRGGQLLLRNAGLFASLAKQRCQVLVRIGVYSFACHAPIYAKLEYMPKSHILEIGTGSPSEVAAEANFLAGLHAEFIRTVGVNWVLPDDLQAEAVLFLKGVGVDSILAETERRNRIVAILNSKFRLNQGRLQSFYDAAALRRVYFDPRTKEHLAVLFNRLEKQEFVNWIGLQGLCADFESFFDPVTPEESLGHLRQQMTEATIKRSDARQGVQDERIQSMLRALFGSWLFEIAEKRRAFALNTNMDANDVEDEYFLHLQKYYPQVLRRACGAIAVGVSHDQIQREDASTLRTWLFAELDEAYERLSNYSYLAFLFRFPKDATHHGKAWTVINDVTLYAERCHKTNLQAGFFHADEISNATVAHVETIDVAKAKFATYQHGFAFRDCIALCSSQPSRENTEAEIDSILLLFEKNVADETPIPCPACRSLNIRGNSYPVFGVKSWECQNSLCPDKSAFDRGNRFSVVSILRTEASRDPKALIPEASLRRWKLDVVEARGDAEILDMFVRHYSLPGDKLTFVNWSHLPKIHLGRGIVTRGIRAFNQEGPDPLLEFEKTPFFNRYLNVASKVPERGWRRIESTPSWLELYQGSCIEVLSKVQQNSVDGAVTSPPYYNAREYSSWPNLYCYLYDMKLAAEGVYRVLKPGGYYLFNIFDYFDNDKIVARSALGKRRLPLGAYMSQIFRRCGFEIAGNIVWHKGEIEGKRNYNQGNRAPFYQLPLNTWEHILVLRKPGNMVEEVKFPGAIFCRPVLKWFNGENRHGHTAPFPEEIPDLLCSRLSRGARVLDPFAGSLTTASVCHSRGQRCISIELYESYCNLGLQKIAQMELQLPLFSQAASG